MDCFKFKRSVVISRVTTKKLTFKMQRKKWEKNQNYILQKNQTPERAVVEELKDKKDVTYVKQIAKWRNIFFLISTLNKWSSPIKIELILEKKNPNICCHLRFKDTNRLKMKNERSYSMQIETKGELGWIYSYHTKKDIKESCYKRQRGVLYIDNRVSSSRRYNSFLKYTWSIYQDRPHIRQQNKSQ